MAILPRSAGSRRTISSLAILLLPVAVVLLLAVAATQWLSHSDSASKVGPLTVNGSWNAIATFPAVTLSPTPGTQPLKIKRDAAVAYPPNGKVYVMGGRHGTDGEDWALANILEYDPSANTFTMKSAQIDPGSQGSIFSANMAAGVLTDANGVRIYAIGGSSVNGQESSSVRVYDPNTDSITTNDPWPANPPRVAGGYAVYNNKMYLFGGFSYQGGPTGQGQVFTDTWQFDPGQPAGARWSQLPNGNLNLGRAFIASAVVDGKLYAIGGDTYVPGNPGTLVPVNNVEVMDLTQPNPSWVNDTALPTARGDMGAWGYNTGTGYEISGKVAVAGGHYATPDNVGYLFDPVNHTWNAFPSMVYATRNYGYTQLNGFLYAMGGYDYTNNTPAGSNNSQRYDASGPPPPTVTGTPPTNTPTLPATNTATETPTPCAGGGLQNGGFETGSFSPGWTILDSVATPEVRSSPSPVHSGTHAAFLGSDPGTEPLGDSSIYQQITVPAGGGTLSYWYYPYSEDSITYDWQDAYVTDTNGNILATIMHVCDSTQTWTNMMYSLSPYAGQTVRIEFLVHQDGFGDVTNMYLDDVQVLTACSTSTPAPPTDTPTNTPVPPSDTPVPPTETAVPLTGTAVPPTDTVVPPTVTAVSATDTPGPSPTACTIQFSDVPPGSTFYQYIHCLACLGIVNGYSNGTFRPDNNVTRGQLVKMVSNSAGWNDTIPPSQQTFQDVPPQSWSWVYVERYLIHQPGGIQGYPCGGPTEPCVPPANLPYFRPTREATRGQIAKIISNAAGFNDTPTGQQFQDVPPNNAFYPYIYRLSIRNIVAGYACGGNQEPCVPPNNLPYFRPDADASRGQAAKMVSLTFFPDCQATRP